MLPETDLRYAESTRVAPLRRGSLAAVARLGMPFWLVLFVLTWLLLVGLTSASPPVDNAEQLSWVRSLEWGYYKHPPLPTVLLWPLVQAFGLHEAVTYLAAGLVSTSALLLAYRLTVALCGAALAELATLGSLCIGYYCHRLGYYNHDVLLLLCGTAAASLCWRAFAARSAAAWLGLGIVLGLGALAKYQVALFGVSVFAWWILRQGWRDPVHRNGLLRATALAAVLFSPHALWMISHDFLPVHYAMANSLGKPFKLAQCSVDVLQWIGGQIVMMMGALLLGAVLYVRARRRRPVVATGAAATVVMPGRAWAYLACWGLLPLLLMVLIGLVTGAQLHRNWGTAFMPFTCAALLMGFGRAVWPQVRRREALIAFAVVQLLLAAVVLQWGAGPAPVLNQHQSSRFSSQWVADAIAPAARGKLGGDIRVIAGPQRLVSVLALRLRERPLVLVDGRHEISPWLPQDMAAMCGILWVGGPQDRSPYEARRHDIGEGLWWAVESLSDDVDACR